MMRSRLPVLAWVLLLAGCAAGPGIPDTVYFRLPPAAPIAALPAPPLEQPIVVGALLADGLHSDQALIYSLDPDGARLKAYHYQLWVDPPVRLLQRRLIGTLRRAGMARIVADRLPHQMDVVRIEGRLERFERVRTAGGWKAVVGMTLRADRRDGKPPLVMRDYELEVAAQGESVSDSVRAIGEAVDRIYADFVRDLAQAAADA